MEKLLEDQYIKFVISYGSKSKELSLDIRNTELTYEEIFNIVDDLFKTLEKNSNSKSNTTKDNANPRASNIQNGVVPTSPKTTTTEPEPKSPELIEM